MMKLAFIQIFENSYRKNVKRRRRQHHLINDFDLTQEKKDYDIQYQLLYSTNSNKTRSHARKEAWGTKPHLKIVGSSPPVMTPQNTSVFAVSRNTIQRRSTHKRDFQPKSNDAPRARAKTQNVTLKTAKNAQHYDFWVAIFRLQRRQAIGVESRQQKCFGCLMRPNIMILRAHVGKDKQGQNHHVSHGEATLCKSYRHSIQNPRTI